MKNMFLTLAAFGALGLIAVVMMRWTSTAPAGPADPPVTNQIPRQTVADDESAHPSATSGTAESRLPQSKHAKGFRPKAFHSLPAGFEGRELTDIYADLSKSASAGDAKAALSLGNAVDECNQILYVLNNNPGGMKSPDPEIQKLLDERTRVGNEQCTKLDEAQLASAGSWLLRSAELGNRAALLRLGFFAPKANEVDFERKKAHWRETLVSGLTALAEGGDVGAMMNLGEFLVEEHSADSRKQALAYFQMAVGAPGASPQQVGNAIRFRDQLQKELAGTGGGSN